MKKSFKRGISLLTIFIFAWSQTASSIPQPLTDTLDTGERVPVVSINTTVPDTVVEKTVPGTVQTDDQFLQSSSPLSKVQTLDPNRTEEVRDGNGALLRTERYEADVLREVTYFDTHLGVGNERRNYSQLYQSNCADIESTTLYYYALAGLRAVNATASDGLTRTETFGQGTAGSDAIERILITIEGVTFRTQRILSRSYFSGPVSSKLVQKTERISTGGSITSTVLYTYDAPTQILMNSTENA